MTVKFIKIADAPNQAQVWALQITQASSGSKLPAVGDIVSVKKASGGKSNVTITEIISAPNNNNYGAITVCKFANR